MQRDVQELRSQTDYILGIDRILFQEVAVQDTRHHSDHYMVMSCLRGEPEKELAVYPRKARRFPILPLRHKLVLVQYKLFSDLKTHIPKPPLRERVKQDWISDKTWAPINARVTENWEGGQWNVRKLS